MSIQQNSNSCFPIRAYELLSHEFLTRFIYQSSIPSCEVVLKSNQKAVGYPSKVVPLLHKCAQLALQVSCLVCKVHSWVTVDDFSSPEAYIVSSSTMKTSQRADIDSSSLISPCSVNKACDIFSNSVHHLVLIGGQQQ